MNKYDKYCTGCGLCESIGVCDLIKDNKGYYHPSFQNSLLEKICPISGVQSYKLYADNIWGKSKSVYLGWSNNKDVRNRASSGGILTEVASYLLTSNKVDCVIHVGADSENPTKTKVFYSTSADDIILHSGSRYCISSPLSELYKLEENKKYAFIGKPCDVVALRNYMEINPTMKEKIIYLLSFFCMGVPSENAQDELLEKLNCKKCKSLQYRGNGWPGFTTATDDDGGIHQMTYDDSWGKILGRDLMPACRFCIDGIGEMADISCGDAWYLTNDNKPDFTEHDGRNIVFGRTKTGDELLNEVKKAGNISLNIYDDYKRELKLTQKSQFNRRRELKYRVYAMKWLLQPHPVYDKKILNDYSKDLSVKRKIEIVLGTIKRIIRRKI